MAFRSKSGPNVRLQFFHRCASLVPIRLTSDNYLLWSSQILPLVNSLRLEQHITDVETPPTVLKEEQTEKINPEFLVWKSNDCLLMTCLKGMMTEDVISMTIGAKSA